MLDTGKIEQVSFDALDVRDSFFDNLRADYSDFEQWFANKSAKKEPVFILNENDGLKAFVYVKKEENEPIYLLDDVVIDGTARYKIGTFKILASGTILGDKFLSFLLQNMVKSKSNINEVYVTVFSEKQTKLVKLFEKFGFVYQGKKSNGESVYLKKFDNMVGDVYKDFPMIELKDNTSVFHLAVYPKYHDAFFSAGKVWNENSPVADNAISNTVTKTYLCKMSSISKQTFKYGDVLAMYRTGGKHGGIISSIARIVEYKNIEDFSDYPEFKNFVGAGTVFSESELRYFWDKKPNPHVIKFVHNYSLAKPRPNLDYIRSVLNLEKDPYWGFYSMSKEKLIQILNKEESNGRFIINSSEVR